MKITAAVTSERGAPFKLETVILDEPKDTEVLVKVAACGICHADLAARDGLHPMPMPVVLGHEGAGVVIKTGRDVRNVKPGDHVVFASYSCGKCLPCLTGHPAACTECERVNFGGYHADGTRRLHREDGTDLVTFFNQSSFATYAVGDERNVIKVDPEVDLRLLGPLGCGIQTGAGTVINKLHPHVGESIVIAGCGAVGLSAVMAAKLAGCYPIIAADINEKRLELAKELGADIVINSKNEPDLCAAVRAAVPAGADYAMDTTGNEKVLDGLLNGLRAGGTCAVVASTGEKIIGIHMQSALMGNSRNLLGVVQGDAVFSLFIPKLIELFKAGRFPYDKLIKFYDFADINTAAEQLHSGQAIKPVLIMPE
ncbi:MAG: NAD(P)-dependent alcohol dehydrogenase [Oscillospiraceae bacterium]|nr:NAD(P)-dependent alcohol dehydrogenase [Oscillospiraceae bacterium]